MSKSPSQPQTASKPLLQRLVPTQKRSRLRYELILKTAAEILLEKGPDTFTMSDIVEKAGVPHGSLYQYFADKTAVIGTLAERSNLEGQACVKGALEHVKTPAELRQALLEITDAYYDFFRSEPLVRELWNATQSNKILQQLDAEDVAILASFLTEAIQRVDPQVDLAKAKTGATLIMYLIAAAVRHAINLDEQQGAQTLNQFKTLLPMDLSVLFNNP